MGNSPKSEIFKEQSVATASMYFFERPVSENLAKRVLKLLRKKDVDKSSIKRDSSGFNVVIDQTQIGAAITIKNWILDKLNLKSNKGKLPEMQENTTKKPLEVIKHMDSALGKYVASRLLTEIRREDMPQINSDDIPAALELFDDYGVKYSKETVPISSLKPTQENYIPSKVDKFVKMFTKEGKECFPLFISEDSSIMDGHHRWLAMEKIHGDDGNIEVIRIHLPKLEALLMFNKASNQVSETIVIFPGRFQPFTLSHKKIYEELVKKFGSNQVYISTSNVHGRYKTPFNFEEKRYIMEQMGIPSDKILRNDSAAGYNFKNLIEKNFPGKDINLIVAMGTKDRDRIVGGKYYEVYSNDIQLETYQSKGYLYLVESPILNASQIREMFVSNDLTIIEKFRKFKTLYESYDLKLFSFLIGKLAVTNNDIKNFINEHLDTFKSLNEVSQAAAGNVDDGPSTFYRNIEEFKRDADSVAEYFGYRVIDYLVGNRDEYADHIYRYDIVPVVSFGEAGVRSASPNTESRWKEYVSKISKQLGHELIDYLGAKFDSHEDTDDVEVVDSIKR